MGKEGKGKILEKIPPLPTKDTSKRETRLTAAPGTMNGVWVKTMLPQQMDGAQKSRLGGKGQQI